jgi:hypothetical protein
MRMIQFMFLAPAAARKCRSEGVVVGEKSITLSDRASLPSSPKSGASGAAKIAYGEGRMPFIDTHSLNVIERLPGWYGRYFHSQSMTFARYDFKRGSTIHEHFHPQEEVYEVIEGELEVTRFVP